MRKAIDEESIPLEARAEILYTVDVKLLRARLGLSQEEFSKFYKIPLERVQAWEYGVRPDEVSQTYLNLIKKEPEWVKSKLNVA